MSGVINSAGSKSGFIGPNPAWLLGGEGQSASTGWPPARLNFSIVTSNHDFVGNGVTLSGSGTTAARITLAYGGLYQIGLTVAHDVGSAAASASELIVFLSVEEAQSYTGTEDYHLSLGGAGGTRSDGNGRCSTEGLAVLELPANSHLYIGGYTSPADQTWVKQFSGHLIR